MASQMIIAPSKDTLFMRGFSSRKDVEDIRLVHLILQSGWGTPVVTKINGHTALLPIIAGYQLSPPENKMFIFQLWSYILKAFCCLFVPFTLEIVLPYLLDLGCYFGEVISI